LFLLGALDLRARMKLNVSNMVETNEELHNLYSSPSIIRIIKSRRMSSAGHEARMGKKRNAYRILMGKPEGERPLGNQDVSGWTILKWILEI
jgi:hypothetical protein